MVSRAPEVKKDGGPPDRSAGLRLAAVRGVLQLVETGMSQVVGVAPARLAPLPYG